MIFLGRGLKIILRAGLCRQLHTQQNDYLIPVPEKSSRAGTWLTRDDGVLFILLQQIGRRAVGLATAEDLATVQAMLQVALGLFFRNLGLAYRRVLNQ